MEEEVCAADEDARDLLEQLKRAQQDASMNIYERLNSIGNELLLLCMLCVGGRTSKKRTQNGHRWPVSVCVNLKKDPVGNLRPMYSTRILLVVLFFAIIKTHSNNDQIAAWAVRVRWI